MDAPPEARERPPAPAVPEARRAPATPPRRLRRPTIACLPRASTAADRETRECEFWSRENPSPRGGEQLRFDSFTVILLILHSKRPYPPMTISSADALSPLDGRYAGKLEAVRHIFSEAGLMRQRVRVECAWFLALAAGPAAAALAWLPPAARDLLDSLSKNPDGADVA